MTAEQLTEGQGLTGEERRALLEQIESIIEDEARRQVVTWIYGISQPGVEASVDCIAVRSASRIEPLIYSLMKASTHDR